MPISKQKRFALAFIILATTLFTNLLQGCVTGNGQKAGTLKALIDTAKEKGLQTSAAKGLDLDDSIQITIQSIELEVAAVGIPLCPCGLCRSE